VPRSRGRGLLSLAAALLLSLAPNASLAQGALGPVDGQGLSPYDLERVKAGDMAPDFRLQDQDGRVHQLSQYRGKNVVLVMYRGFW
jgi:peroxiredoxin Q/BCP